MSQFYIKLDKKLIVDIENIHLKSKKSKVNNSLDDLERNLSLLPKILKIFKKIEIERLIIDGNEFTISLNDEFLFLDNKFINLSSKIDFASKRASFDLYSLYLKDYDLLIDGKVKVDYVSKNLNHYGKFFYKHLEGGIKLDANENDLSFSLNSRKFDNLHFLKGLFRLDKVAEEWMYNNVKGDFQLDEFYGKIDLDKNKLLEKKIYARATINNAQIKFDKNLDVIKTKKLNLVYKNDNLSIDLIEPKYKNNKLDGSNVLIKNLTNEKKGIVQIKIESKALLNDEILEILKNYKINLPLKQEKGLSKSLVVLSIPYSSSKKMDVKGEFLLQNALINLSNFKFESKKAKVLLDNNLVKIINTDFKYRKLINSNINLILDTNTLKAKGDAIIKSLYINDGKDSIIDLKDKKTTLNFEINNDIKILLNDLKTRILINEFINVYLADLKLFYEDSNLLKTIPIKDGNLSLKIKDENNIFFKAFAKGLQFPIRDNNKQITQLDVEGYISKDLIKVTSSDKRIEFTIKDKHQELSLKDLEVFLDTKNNDEKKQTPNIDIYFQNVLLSLDDDKYQIKKGKAFLDTKQVDFQALVLNPKVPLRKNGKELKSLSVIGFVNDDETNIRTIDDKIKFSLKQNKMNVFLDSYDIYLNTKKDPNKKNEEEKKESLILDIKTKNSNILLNDKFKFLSNTFEARIREESKYINLKYKNSEFIYKLLENGKINLYGNDFNDEYINTIFDKHVLDGGKLMLTGVGTKESIKGKLLITDTKIDDLAIINNLLLFIHTSPALINPLLAIPSVVGAASNGGFNLNGYTIKDGLIEYNYQEEKDLLDIKKLITIGNGIDFDGKGSLDLKTNNLDTKIKLIFFKNYSSIVGAIPVVNYVLLGSDKRVETMVDIFGPLNNPKIKTNLTKDAFSIPLNIAKRIFTSPAELVKYINESIGNQENNENEVKTKE